MEIPCVDQERGPFCGMAIGDKFQVIRLLHDGVFDVCPNSIVSVLLPLSRSLERSQILLDFPRRDLLVVALPFAGFQFDEVVGDDS